MSRRTEKLSSVIREEITSLITAGKIKDPRVHELTTITGVRVSRDLSVATVYYSVLGESDDIEKTGSGLEAAAGYIQRHLAKNMKMRVIPKLRFSYDSSVAYGDRMNKILSGLPEFQENVPENTESLKDDSPDEDNLK